MDYMVEAYDNLCGTTVEWYRLNRLAEESRDTPWMQTYLEACVDLEKSGDLRASMDSWIGLLDEDGLIPTLVAVGAGFETIAHIRRLAEESLGEDPDLSPFGDLLIELYDRDLRDAANYCQTVMLGMGMGIVHGSEERSFCSRMTYLLGLAVMQIVRRSPAITHLSSMASILRNLGDSVSSKKGGRPVPHLKGSTAFFSDLRSETARADRWDLDTIMRRCYGWAVHGFDGMYHTLEDIRSGYVSGTIGSDEGRARLSEFVREYETGPEADDPDGVVCAGCLRWSPRVDGWVCPACGSTVTTNSPEIAVEDLSEATVSVDIEALTHIANVHRGSWIGKHANACRLALDCRLEEAFDAWGAIPSMPGADLERIREDIQCCLESVDLDQDGDPLVSIDILIRAFSSLQDDGDLSMERRMIGSYHPNSPSMWGWILAGVATAAMARAADRESAADIVLTAYFACDEMHTDGWSEQYLDTLYSVIDGLDDDAFDSRGDPELLQRAYTEGIWEGEPEDIAPILREYFGQ